ncbi:MAG: Asp-tRNA(Asn)/Glu-tRNA(Gln) amidotransferase subunit GatB [Candidatus Pacebacteria bacterium]|jgi:aspartyl-tRNA(Asn)/glutamyl-tRNA(Gln) amidotransferase subunit B|nr:Asp-tRNA(Asn)/Glu-tRNA(Gln) amidotransferase subunit GatB [Candidatus Paceibacterota bacterium]
MKNDYKATIGLEIHAELRTKSKMFCSCPNLPDEDKPNTHICPVCMGHPGTLPVLNKEAIKHVLKVGIAANGNLADFTEWDRKNYFYPDIPKGYQISQYKYPLVSGGEIGGVKITRIHLEEDTASSTHDTHDTKSLVNFNRAGVPLMELVTEPVIHSGEEAANFAKELQLLLRYLGVGHANLEKGEMRVEANISVSKTDKFGTKTEVKNLNSFKSVERAIAYEIDRQIALLEEGDKVAQETRGWDEQKNKTFSQRVKEDSHDYRYFPDPDIPKLLISEIPEFAKEVLKKEIGELPWEKRNRLVKDFSLTNEEAEIMVIDPTIGKYFEAIVSKLNDKKLVKLATNYLVSDYIGLLKKLDKNIEEISAESFAELIQMIGEGILSSRGAKDLLKIMTEEGGKPRELAVSRNILVLNDTKELEKIAAKIIDESPKVVTEYKAGKTSVFQYFIGQAMKETRGTANPEVMREIFERLLR